MSFYSMQKYRRKKEPMKKLRHLIADYLIDMESFDVVASIKPHCTLAFQMGYIKYRM